MKKLLSTIMALVMLLSLVPMAVAEEGEVTGSDTKTETTVAEIGGLYYDTLADAVAAVRVHGNTVTLVGDVTLSETVVVDKDLTVDMNGHNITANNVRALHQKQGTLNITGKGTIASNKTQDGTFDADKSVIRVGDDNATGAAVFTLGEGVTVTSNHCYGVTYFGMKDETLTINGTVAVTGNATALSGNGASKYKDVNVSVTVNGTVTAEKANAIYKPEKGTLTINGVVKGAGGIEVKSGTVTIGANAEVTAVAATTSHSVNSNGCSTSGYALVAVANKNYQDNVNITVSGGKVIGQVAKVTDHTDAPEGKLAISGGAFTDLANAVKYATDGAKITLAGDATGDVVIPADKTITIDLGGHKLTNVSGNTITNEGTLTITGTGTVDNVTDGKAALYNKNMATLNGGTFERSAETGVDKDTSGGNSFYTVLNHGTMTVNKGVVVNNKGHHSSLFENGYFNYNNRDGVVYPDLVINGGTFDGGLNTIKNDDNATLVINSGTFKNYTQACVQNHHVAEIHGGEYIGDKAAAVLMCGACTTVDETHDKHQMSITGGNFKGALTVNVGKLTINGGAFTADPSKYVTDANLVVVPGVKDAPYTVQPKTRDDENTKTEVEVDGDKVTTTVTDKATGTTTETVTDTTTGAKTETKTESKVEGNVTTKTKTVTEKNAAGDTTKVTESKIVENNENGKTATKTTVDGTTVKTDATVERAPTTASDVTLDAKALEGKAGNTDTSSVTVDNASLNELKSDTVKDVIIETDQATLKLDKTAVKTMESKVEDSANGKMTLAIKVTEEKAAEEITKIAVEVTATNEAGDNVFPKDTEHTNGVINITVPYTGNATYLDLWYTTTSGSTYMGRFPVVNGFVSFDVKHFSQYDLIPVTSSGSSVIKNGSTSSAASGTHTVTTDLTPGSITKVTVDGKVVDAKYYTINGSNVTFTAEFLKTLKNGSHTVTVENATKIAKGVFTVNNPTGAQSPTTADAGVALYAGMAIASVMGTGVVFTSRKRKNH